MYRNYFGLNSLPFKTTPDIAMFYKNSSRQDVLDALIYTISRGDGIVKVTGEVGSGKTMLLRLLAEHLPSHFKVVYINSPNLSSKDILLYICSELGLEVTSNTQKFTLTNQLKNELLSLYSLNKKVVMLVDEAQTMSIDVLEELRLLSNIETDDDKLLQMVLFGQPELDNALEHCEIRQLKSRISYNIYVTPFKGEDVHAYLNHRMRKSGYEGLDVFSLSISKKIQKLTGGLPRNINIIADKLLLSAFSSGDLLIKQKHLKNLTELDGSLENNLNSKKKWLLIGLICTLVIFILFLFLVNTNKNNSILTSIIHSKVSQNSPISIKGIVPESNESILGTIEGKNTAVLISESKKTKISNIIPSEIGNNDNIGEMSGASYNAEFVESADAIPSYGNSVNNPLESNILEEDRRQLLKLLKYHNAGKQWLTALDDIYVIQLSTRNIQSLETALQFYKGYGLNEGDFHLLIDYQKNIDMFRFTVFYLGSSQYSILKKAILRLPKQIRASKPFIEKVESVRKITSQTDIKLKDIGIVNEL